MSIHRLNHDELIEKIFEEYKKSCKKKYTSLFLSSLSSGKLYRRSGLPVLAVMQTFPKHIFTARKNAVKKALFDKMSKEDKEFTISRLPCKFCSDTRNLKNREKFIIECFYEEGALVGFSLQYFYYYLSEANKLEEVEPTKKDFSIFSEILKVISETNTEETLKKVVLSKIAKIKGFKSNTEQRKAILETLGYCSILETKEHKGLLREYTNLAVAPTKTHNSDWRYPVDFWLGKDGINKEAFEFWFGEYPQLDRFWG